MKKQSQIAQSRKGKERKEYKGIKTWAKELFKLYTRSCLDSTARVNEKRITGRKQGRSRYWRLVGGRENEVMIVS